MQRRMGFLILLAIFTTACSSEIDYRNVDFHNGLAYKHGSDEPFSGTIVYPQEPDVVSHYLTDVRNMLGVLVISLDSDKCLVGYSGGDIEGDVSCQDSDGKKTIQFHISKGFLDGEASTYSHGQIRSRFHWNKGRPDGNQRVYSQEGIITHEWNSEGGVRTGEEIYKTAEGKLIAEGKWADGKFTGTYFDGKSLYTLDHGVKSGSATIRWDGSDKAIEGDFEKDIPTGTWTYPSYEALWKDVDSVAQLPPGFRELLSVDGVEAIAVQRVGNHVEGGVQGFDKEGRVIVSFAIKDGFITAPVIRKSPVDGKEKKYDQPSVIAALNYRNESSVQRDGYWVGPNQRAAFEAQQKSEREAQETANEERGMLVNAVVNMTDPVEVRNVPLSSDATENTDGEDCLNHWIDAFHKENGDDAAVAADQLDEWTGWCKEGKQAPGF